MAKKEKIEIKVDETPVLETPSEAKARFQAIIDAYKIQNPVKYQIKKAALEAELAKFDK